MTLGTLLGLAGGAIFIVLGSLHGLYTLLDLRHPRRFAPSDPTVRRAMEESTVRLSRGRATLWDAWLGFNLSHSLGVVLFGAVAIAVTLGDWGLGLRLAVAGVSAVYFLVAIRFWFSIPILGSGLATACLLVAALLAGG